MIRHATTGTTYVYAACGADSQVQRFDATNWFATGGTAPTVRFQVYSPGVQPIRNVLADPTVLHRFFVLTAGSFRIVLNEVNPSNPATRSIEPNVHKGSPHDIVHVKSMGTSLDPLESVWTTGDGTADHVCKVLDVTPLVDPQMLPVDLIDEYPALSSSDGGVYVDFGAKKSRLARTSLADDVQVVQPIRLFDAEGLGTVAPVSLAEDGEL